MATWISHKGKIVKVGTGMVTVAIAPDQEECHGCAISRICRKAELLDVPLADAEPQMLGREVSVDISASSQHNAVITLLVIPIVLLFAVLIVGIYCFGLREGSASVWALSALAIWYLLIFFMRRRFTLSLKISLIDS